MKPQIYWYSYDHPCQYEIHKKYGYLYIKSECYKSAYVDTTRTVTCYTQNIFRRYPAAVQMAILKTIYEVIMEDSKLIHRTR